MRKMSGKKEAQKAGLAAEQGNRRRRGGKRLSPAPARRWVGSRVPETGGRVGQRGRYGCSPYGSVVPVHQTALPDRPIIWIGAYSPAYRERGGLSVLALAALRRDARRRKRGRAARKRTVGDSFTLTDGILCAVLFRRSRAATAHRAVPGRKAAGTSALLAAGVCFRRPNAPCRERCKFSGPLQRFRHDTEWRRRARFV